jgi:hypothetical protein
VPPVDGPPPLPPLLATAKTAAMPPAPTPTFANICVASIAALPLSTLGSDRSGVPLVGCRRSFSGMACPFVSGRMAYQINQTRSQRIALSSPAASATSLTRPRHPSVPLGYWPPQSLDPLVLVSASTQSGLVHHITMDGLMLSTQAATGLDEFKLKHHADASGRAHHDARLGSPEHLCESGHSMPTPSYECLAQRRLLRSHHRSLIRPRARTKAAQPFAIETMSATSVKGISLISYAASSIRTKRRPSGNTPSGYSRVRR